MVPVEVLLVSSISRTILTVESRGRSPIVQNDFGENNPKREIPGS
jgi:hypothetical protein